MYCAGPGPSGNCFRMRKSVDWCCLRIGPRCAKRDDSNRRARACLAGRLAERTLRSPGGRVCLRDSRVNASSKEYNNITQENKCVGPLLCCSFYDERHELSARKGPEGAKPARGEIVECRAGTPHPLPPAQVLSRSTPAQVLSRSGHVPHRHAVLLMRIQVLSPHQYG